MGELATKIRAKYPGSYDDLPDDKLEAQIIAKYPGVYDDLATPSKPKPKPAPEQRSFVESALTPNTPTERATSLKDLATRVLPESVYKLPGRLLTGAYEAVKGQTDPIVKGFTTEFDNPEYSIGSEMKSNAVKTLGGLANAVVAPTGLLGLEKAKESWLTDPAGSALAVAPMIKPTMKVVKTIPAEMTAIKPEVAAKRIGIDYQKAVRPSVKGTAGNAAQVAKADKGYIEGVYDVVEAKNNGVLKLGDDQVSKLPSSLQEHLDAVSQARQDAFKIYNDKKIAAEGNGVEIDLSPVANTLRQAAQDRALNTVRPSVVQYMNDLADRFKSTGRFTPSEAQSALQAYNSLVDWSKATPEVAANAMVEKSVAAQLKNLLDDAIMNDGNPGYAADRLKYGRLAKMEKEAAHRARVAGRAAPSSLFDGMAGVLSSAELVSGLLSMNPASIARAGGIKAFQSIRNKMNSPDYQIKRMYKTAEKSYSR